MSDPSQILAAIKLDEKDIAIISKNKKIVAKLTSII